ncbi:MAG: type II toxin-antitoxin system RelE/ParE family toxin [Butyrivibrio sp.]|nr:type II toxin-antitoxin system RelE/ParE family toxin [Butyrivibrio sp.]
MAYNIVISERADELIDSCVSYIMNRLKNPQAAEHLINRLDGLYERLIDNPYQFDDCKDDFLKHCGYKEALITDMKYRIIFRISEDTVYIVGLFHDLEDYKSKVWG